MAIAISSNPWLNADTMVIYAVLFTQAAATQLMNDIANITSHIHMSQDIDLSRFIPLI